MQLDHGALHALVGNVGERCRLQRYLVGLGEREERAQLRLVDGVGLEGAAQTGVDGKTRGEGECRGLGQAGLGEIMEQAGVVLVDGGEGILDIPELELRIS